MMPFGFSTVIAAWLALLAIPLVIFYFLKLKRPSLSIPSLVLWRQVLNDDRVNSPFQRFKRHLLLWLQLLLLVLLVLAAMQPYWHGGTRRHARIPILIDCSASMAARSEAGGRTRMAEAKRRAATHIRNLVKGQELCLITFDRSAHRLTAFTDNKRLLFEALDRVAASDLESDLEDALRIAQAMSRDTPVDEVIILTDGNLPPETAMKLPFRVTIQQLGEEAPNVGITSVRAIRRDAHSWQVFVAIDASAAYRGPATVDVHVDGTPLAREVVAPSYDHAERLSFVVPADAQHHVSITLVPEPFDAMASDNAAAIELPPLRPARLYVSPDLAACRRAAAAMTDVQLYPAEARPHVSGYTYDAAILGPSPAAHPEAMATLLVDTVPSSLTNALTRLESSNRLIDWDRNDPLMRHVMLQDVILTSDIRFYRGHGVDDVEAAGYDVVIHGEHGPLMLMRETGSEVEYLMLTGFADTTLPYRLAFPVMLANLVDIALQRQGLSEINARQTGLIEGLHAAPGKTCSIRLPDHTSLTVTADDTGRLPAVPAPFVGTYSIPETQTECSVALLSRLESQLVSAERIQFAEVSVATAGDDAKGTRPLWRFIALVALILLLIEWCIFHRLRMATVDPDGGTSGRNQRQER